jgi:hypothetical protein
MRQGMNKRDLAARELSRLPEQDLDRLLGFFHALNQEHADAAMPLLAGESSLAKDWLTPEEDAAWANL